MTAQEVFEKYKHMDKMLLEGLIFSESFRMKIIADLWAAIIHTIQEGEGRKGVISDGEETKNTA